MASSSTDSIILFPPDVIPQLMCSCCLEEFNDPKDLECGHTFCKKCLEHCIKSNPDDTCSFDGNEDQIPVIRCPECRAPTKKPKTLHDLKTNFALRNVLEKVVHERQKQKSIRMCFEHTEKQNVYCVTCKRIICHSCTLLDHSKPTHEWKMLDDVYEEQKKSLEDVVEEVKRTSRKFLGFMRNKKSIEAEIHLAADKVERDICSDFEDLSFALQTEKEKLVEEVRKIKESRIKKLEQEHADAAKIVIKINSETQLIQEAEEQGNLHDYVLKFSHMRESLQDLCGARPPQTGHDMNLLHYLPKRPITGIMGYIAAASKVTLEFYGEFGMGLMWGLGDVSSIAASPDGLIAVTESRSKRISLWEMNHGQYNLKFYIGSHLKPLLQDLFSKQIGFFMHQTCTCPTDIAVTSTGKFVVVDRIHGVRLYSKTGSLEKFSNDASTRPPSQVECIATDDQDRVYICKSSLIGAYEKAPQEEGYRRMYLKTLVVKAKPQKLSTDGKLVIILAQDSEDFDLPLVHRIKKHDVKFVPLDESLQGPGEDAEDSPKVIIVYDLDFWDVMIAFEVTSDVNSICYDRRTGSLFVATDSGCIDQYSINSGKFMGHLLTGLMLKPKDIALTNNGTLLAVANSATVKLLRIINH